MKKNYSKKDIAIVGISGRFPKSQNANEFWERLVNGELLSKFYSDDELVDLGVDKHHIDEENFVKVSALLEGAESFDHSFFGYTREEAGLMDPQIRVMHEQVWLALEDANITPEVAGRTGLYLAASDNLNWRAHALMAENEKVNPFYLSQLTNKNFISTLISYSLNLKGPSYYMDTACSSSLVAVHLACRNLLMKECSVAIAGGVSISSTNDYGYFYQEGMINSKDGHCKAFDADSSGTIGGEGVGVVVLKRLENAMADGDRIYAVIKSSAVNNDGKRKVGFTAPSIKGQYECIKMAHQIAGVEPNLISYVETHGTGTKIGDPIEVGALNKAFNNERSHQCAIGSVKTNMGHLDAAAGIAGLMKTALAIKNKQIPASLHYEKPNPEINFEDGPFFVNTTLKKWETKEMNPVYAGVSSFGIGGTNAHLVLSEFQGEEPKNSPSRPYQLITCSAKTKKALDRHDAELKTFLKDFSGDLSNLTYTQKVGRKSFEYRNFRVTKSKLDALEDWENMTVDSLNPVIGNRVPDLVFMFPGQGNQYVEMGKELYHQEQLFKDIMDQGFEILKKETGKDFKEIIGYGTEGNQGNVNDTENTQPLLFLVEYALAKLLINWGVSPQIMIGHSLGEYVAACVSGVFSLEQGVRIILKRGELMSRVAPGDMLGIAASVKEIDSMLAEGLSIAAVNTGQSCVVSGTSQLINGLEQALSGAGIPFSKLKTSHAFHSNMMDEILEEFKEVLSQETFSNPEIPFISNVSGKEILAEEAKSPEYWAKHLRETVQFSEGIGTILQRIKGVFLEVGPGRGLSTFLKQNADNTSTNQTILTLKHAKESINDNEKLTIALGNLWNSGVRIDWEAYYEKEARNKISIPKYSFEKSEFPLRVDPFKNIEGAVEWKRRPLEKWFYESSWKISRSIQSNPEGAEKKGVLIFQNGSSLADKLIEKYKENSDSVISVQCGNEFQIIGDNSYRINSKSKEDYEKLFTNLKGLRINNVIYFPGEVPRISEENEVAKRSFYDVLEITKELNKHDLEEPVDFTIITSDFVDVIGVEETNGSGALVNGLITVISQENPMIQTRCIDFWSEENNEKKVNLILKEQDIKGKEKIVAYRHNKRWIKTYNSDIVSDPVKESSELKSGGVYLLTGGLGGLGFVYAKYLLEKYNASLILVGRSDIRGTGSEVNMDKLRRLEMLESLGEVTYFAADIADLQKMIEVVEKGETLYGSVNGIIHTAGTTTGKSFRGINFLDWEDCQEQFSSKTDGVNVLGRVFEDRKLDFCLLTSSMSSILGGKEFAAYAAANTYMDFFARNTRLKNCISVNYDGLNNVEGGSGNLSMNEEEMIEVLERSLNLKSLKQIIVSIEDLNQQIEKWVYPSPVEMEEWENIEIDRSVLSSNYKPAETDTETKMVEVFQDFFGLSNLGVNDDFFELGGDSLKAMILINQIHKNFEVEMTLADFFEFETIHKLARVIDTRKMLSQSEETENSIII